MLLYAACSSAFGLTYVVGRAPVWISFGLQQAEAALFLGCAVLVARLGTVGRSILLAAVYGVAVALIVPAAHLAGEDQLHFLAILPLLVALTDPEHPWTVFASGMWCVAGSAVLIFGLGHGRTYNLAMTAVIAVGAAYGVYRLREARRKLDELKALQSNLVQQERLAALGEAAAVIAHEVRNPLGAISNAVALVRKDPDVRERLLSMIDEEVAALDSLVHQLLVLARPMEARFRATNLGELLKRSAELACAGVSLDQIRVDTSQAEVSSRTDPELLQLALVNVLRNALQASPGGSPVRVTCRGTEADLQISIEDEGPGIAPEIRARLFEPFVTTRSAGSGLGLAIAKRVVDAHAGTISISSATNGQGTRFDIVVPQLPRTLRAGFVAPARRG